MENNCNKLRTRVSAPLLEGSEIISYKVSDSVYLAGQPEREDWQKLAKQGFKLVINVRSDVEKAAAQAQSAQEYGLTYIHLQVPAYELESEHVHAFHEALAQAQDGKVLFHCRTASRVALMWMLHRMLHDQWSQEQAEAELQAAGYEEDDMAVFRYCTEDFLEREQMLELKW